VRARILRLRIGWICLAVVSLGILVFGVVVALVPMGHDQQVYRADGLASIGLGLFGGLIAIVPYRRAERWAWFALWFYPLFWLAHLVGQLPPGTDHVHQVVFIVLSLGGLLLPVRSFFPSGAR
jgi:peptidoglycan/LPS O-acetylase OafA/YrhL